MEYSDAMCALEIMVYKSGQLKLETIRLHIEGKPKA